MPTRSAGLRTSKLTLDTQITVDFEVIFKQNFDKKSIKSELQNMKTASAKVGTGTKLMHRQRATDNNAEF